jgi:predicted amidohydrolase
VKVAACQLGLSVGDVTANRAAAAAAVEEAAGHGADLVVLPELCDSGYVFSGVEEARALAAPAADNPTLQGWRLLAGQHATVIAGGFCELGQDGRLYNSAAVVSGDGVLAVYRKAHLWDAEKLVFTPGDRPPPVVSLPFGRVGLMVCYDLEFPEWVRLAALGGVVGAGPALGGAAGPGLAERGAGSRLAERGAAGPGLALGGAAGSRLAERGADLIAAPVNWPAMPVPAGERPADVVRVQAEASMNRVFIAVADRCRPERGVSWVGGTVIVGPDGYPLAGPVVADRSAVLVAPCDLAQARDKRVSTHNDVLTDRRPALYRPVAQ